MWLCSLSNPQQAWLGAVSPQGEGAVQQPPQPARLPPQSHPLSLPTSAVQQEAPEKDPPQQEGRTSLGSLNS